MNPKVFPVILVILDVCAAVAYGVSGEPWRCVYWLAAALISTSAIMM
jgi:hypothetical protein